jgi:hypothetical protein
MAPVRLALRFLVALVCAVAIGCSTSRDPASLFVPQDVGTLVVDAVLIVGRPAPRVTVTRALSPEVAYTLEAAGETGATVRVQELPSGPVLNYTEDDQPGVYLSTDSTRVKPNTTYALTVVTIDGEIVGAETTTPEAFKVDQWLLLDETGDNVRRELATYDALGDSVYSAPENQVVYADGLLEARFSRPNVVAFQIGVFSLDPESDFVIEPEFFDPEDFEAIERQGSSPALEALDGYLRLPWFTIFFEGRYKIRVLALDRNAADWVRSLPQGDSGFNFGGTLGESFERPIFHVDGGIGLFGSAQADSIGFFVLPRPQTGHASH